MQGANIGGLHIKIDYGAPTSAAPPPPTADEKDHYGEKPRKTLFLSYPRHVRFPTEREVVEEFSEFGEVAKVNVCPDLHCVFVNFEHLDDAMRARGIPLLPFHQ
jgi:hypothetical protein